MNDNIRLNNGNFIPPIGLGLSSIGYSSNYSKIPKNLVGNILTRGINKYMKRPYNRFLFVKSIVNALDSGYRLIDNSISYKNEKLIAQAIRNSSISRKDVFLTSRVSNSIQYHGNINDEFFKMLDRYETDYIDLFQFHWPVTGCYINTWCEMVKLYHQGYIKNLGVANCNIHHLKEIIQSAGVIPSVNQIEVHPLFSQVPLRNYCKEMGIQIQSYSSIARCDDRLIRLPILKKIACKYHKSIIQIILRWHVQSNLIPIVRSHNALRQKENINIFDFILSKEEMEAIDKININARIRYDPDNCDFTIL